MPCPSFWHSKTLLRNPDLDIGKKVIKIKNQFLLNDGFYFLQYRRDCLIPKTYKSKYFYLLSFRSNVLLIKCRLMNCRSTQKTIFAYHTAEATYFIYIYFILYIYPPDSQESDEGANT